MDEKEIRDTITAFVNKANPATDEQVAALFTLLRSLVQRSVMENFVMEMHYTKDVPLRLGVTLHVQNGTGLTILNHSVALANAVHLGKKPVFPRTTFV